MKFTLTPLSFRHVLGLAAAGAALLSASSAHAQSPQSPYYTFQVVNDTLSSGDPLYSITDDLTFSNLAITEVYADSFSQTILIPSLDTNTIAEQSDAFYFDTSTAGVLNSPVHGALTSALLTGSIGAGAIQTVNVETSFGGPIAPELISSNFSASLFGPSVTALGLGTFSLLDSNNNTISGFPTIVIGANPVPETSTAISLGIMLTLSLGLLAVSRRRAAAE